MRTNAEDGRSINEDKDEDEDDDEPAKKKRKQEKWEPARVSFNRFLTHFFQGTDSQKKELVPDTVPDTDRGAEPTADMIQAAAAKAAGHEAVSPMDPRFEWQELSDPNWGDWYMYPYGKGYASKVGGWPLRCAAFPCLNNIFLSCCGGYGAGVSFIHSYTTWRD